MAELCRKNKALVASLILFAGVLFSHREINRLYTLPFPPFRELLVKYTGMQDISFIVFGFRDLGADVAWVQLLQYVGGPSVFDEVSKKKFELVEYLTLRTTRIDPYFRQAYIFGASILGWIKVINRPDEALDVLDEGLKYNPKFWPLHMYVAGLGFKKKNEMGKMLEMLANAILDPDCPVTVKGIVARSYEEQKRYPEAIAIWKSILADERVSYYHAKARSEIFKLLRHSRMP